MDEAAAVDADVADDDVNLGAADELNSLLAPSTKTKSVTLKTVRRSKIGHSIIFRVITHCVTDILSMNQEYSVKKYVRFSLSLR